MSALKILKGKPVSKGTLRRSMRRWVYNIRMSLEEIGANTRNWVDAAQERGYCRTLLMRHSISGFHKTWNYLVNKMFYC